MRILVAEDEPRVADAIARGLRRHGAAVDVSNDGAGALYKARVHRYDVVVLDRDLPELHGDEVCRAINAEQPDTRVLMVTAARTTDDLVEGLALGADDYLSKPFRFDELVARVKALARRSGPGRPVVLERGDVRLDVSGRRAWRGDAELALSPKELGVLEVLMKADGGIVSAEELLAQVWDENVDPFTSTVRMTVMGLRRKLGDPPFVHTVARLGYKV